MGRQLIVLDPGHGGEDPGAIGPKGTKEKDIALNFAYHTKRLLELDYKVVMTREKDDFVSLKARADMANDLSADLFISIHCNGFKDPAARGFEVYTSRGQTESDKVATNIYKRAKIQVSHIKLRTDFRDGDPDKEAGFYVLTKTIGPAVLVELGFITNPAEEQFLLSYSCTNRLSRAIKEGVDDYFRK